MPLKPGGAPDHDYRESYEENRFSSSQIWRNLDSLFRVDVHVRVEVLLAPLGEPGLPRLGLVLDKLRLGGVQLLQLSSGSRAIMSKGAARCTARAGGIFAR